MNSKFVSETMQEVFENLMSTPADHLREMLDNARDMGISGILEYKKALEAADAMSQGDGDSLTLSGKAEKRGT
ncbi:MAG: hypothetical protein HQK99_02480 [Nitrospirae bacterium]|nr:hypothetical protein [Nitrospirota bacterium]